MGQKVSAAGADLGLWPGDVTTDRSTAHHERSGTVGGGGCCAARTEVSKHTNVGRNEITVVPDRTVGGNRTGANSAQLSFKGAEPLWPICSMATGVNQG